MTTRNKLHIEAIVALHRILSLMLASLLLFVTSAAHSQSETMKLRVGYIPIAECAHIYVGLAKKYFEREGLDIDLQPMSGGAVILPATQKGNLDIGFTNVVSLITLNSKLPVGADDAFVSLAGASYERPTHINHALLVKHGREIKLPDFDRGGIRVAINTPRNIEELMLRRFLKKQHINPDSLIIVPMSFPDMVSALDRGDIDIAAEVEPFIEPLVRSGRASILTHQYLEVSPNTVVATYAVTRKWLRDNRDAAARFRRAFERAAAFINENDAETRQIIGSYTRINKRDLPIIGIPAFEASVSDQSLRLLVSDMRKEGFLTSAYSALDILSPAN